MPPPANADRAIVVGISTYPKFAPVPLQGPVKDALDVADWLGNVAGAHVTLITSNGQGGQPWQVTNSRARPNRQDIEDGFHDYIDQALSQTTFRLGRRLYVYMAGHGFSPEPRHLALITANALSDISVPNIQATSWIDWFSEQPYFDECVLWMDCCATRVFDYEGGKPLMKKTAMRQGDRAKVFMAFASGSREAFEGPTGPNGDVRGLFTDRLLRGLKGAAAPDSSGIVRTSDLIAYLKNQQGLVGDAPTPGANAMPAFAPVFPETAELVLARGNLPTYRLKVALPDGAKLTILDAQKAVIGDGQVANGVLQIKLPVGIFKADGPGISKLFEIGSGTTSEVDLA